MRHGVLCTIAAVLLALTRADAAPQTDSMLAEIATALSNNEAHKAELLATTALAGEGLTGLQRSRLLLNRGLAYELQGAHAGALVDLTQAIEIHALPQREQAFALFERGMALDGLGRLADALGDYDGSIKLVPDSAPTLNNRANVYRRLNRPDEAKRDYLASLAAGNTQPEYPYFGLGQIAEAQNDTEAARGYYAKAVAASPGYRLAADRLEALGGQRDGAMAESGIIRLRPPAGMATASAAQAATIPPTVPMTAAAKIPAVPPLPDPASAPPIRLRPPQDQIARVSSAEMPLRPAIMDRDGSVGRGPQVQLGSWRQEAEATEAWSRALKRAGDDLAGLAPHIVPVDLPGRGRYYRLRVSSNAGAAKLCASLSAKGLDCLPVRD